MINFIMLRFNHSTICFTMTYLNMCTWSGRVRVCSRHIVFNIPRCCLLDAGPLRLSPRQASLLGGSAITVTGPCFKSLSCRFDNIVVAGHSLSQKKAICVTPTFVRVGVIPVSVSVDGGVTFMPAGDVNIGRTAHSLEWRFVLQQCHSNIDCHLLLWHGFTVSEMFQWLRTTYTQRLDGNRCLFMNISYMKCRYYETVW